MGKHRCLRPRACIQMEKRSFGQCNYIGDCRWCVKYRKVPNYYGGRIHTSIFSKTEGTQKGIRWSEGLYNLKGSDKFDIQEKLSKPDHVTTSTPQIYIHVECFSAKLSSSDQVQRCDSSTTSAKL